jgi:DNA-directed RNA polymerase subunit RPC12/RpoP
MKPLTLANLLKNCFYLLFAVADSNLHSGTNETASAKILSAPEETLAPKMMMSENDSSSKSESYSSLFATREKGSTSNSVVNIKELDLEKVLEEQETHDLYCPNCNSCITRRVILKKRKRIAKDVKSDLRPEKLPNLGQIETANENLDEREQINILFKCLSCFSFFIPTGMYNIIIVCVLYSRSEE